LLFASVVWDSWQYIAEEQVPSFRHANDVVGAYIAIGCRMQMYAYLDKFGDRSLYCDNDSVIYVFGSTEYRL